MDHREAQLHQEIVYTRQAIDDKLAQLEHWGWQTIHKTKSTALDAIDYESNVQWVQKTRGRGAAVMARYPWLIVAGGMLLGYCLSRGGAAQHRHAPLSIVRSYEVPPGHPTVGLS
jgi:hypothetical protein